MSAPFDFAALEEHLYAGCLEAIEMYADVAEPGDPAVCFMIDADPYNGGFLPSFDTRANALACMRGSQAAKLDGRDWMNDPEPGAWREAHEYARAISLALYNDEVGDFSHHMIHDLAYDVSALVDGPDYEQLNADAGKDGWIEGHCRAVLARVCDRLVDGGAFAALELGTPFGVGYCYSSEPPIVCRAIL